MRMKKAPRYSSVSIMFMATSRQMTRTLIVSLLPELGG
jgi:hypothetical protein